MRQVTVPVNILDSGAYQCEPVIVDQYLTPSSISFYTDGDGTVEVSYADPFPVNNGNFVAQTNWDWQEPDLTKFPNGANFIGQPIKAIRVSGTTGGTSTFTVIQAGDR